MPMYDCYCHKCKTKSEMYQTFEDYDKDKKLKCDKCGSVVTRLVSPPTLHTDTNFHSTGVYDKRLGCKIEGRKHWKQKLKEKGYVELDSSYMKNLA